MTDTVRVADRGAVDARSAVSSTPAWLIAEEPFTRRRQGLWLEPWRE
jgi:hypothetical protein